MKTYLNLWFSSDGSRPLKVTKKLRKMGFEPTKGNYDYIYKWDDEATLDEVLSIGDKIQNGLKGDNVLFELETE